MFCKIVTKEIPSEVIWEDSEHIAFLSIFPNTDGFTVVATKKHKPSYAFENDDDTLSLLVLASKKVAKFIDGAFEDVGRTGMVFEGFGVDHLHSKLIPMHGTGNMDEWEMIERKDDKVFYDVYPGFLTTLDSEKADDKQLRQIADKIRKVTRYKK